MASVVALGQGCVAVRQGRINRAVPPGLGAESLLPQPLFRILLVGSFPELEVERRGVAVDFEGAELFARLHFLAVLDTDLRQLAIKGEILAVLHQYTLAVAWHEEHLADFTVEDAEDIGSFGRGERDARVVRQLQVLVNGMVVDAETF